ncbi:F-box protein SKIP19-like [Lolium rigidum]|uniref:F-box protein SKIP19-like n=1 Tax=Lolium rigidum TaxID=89674 RepID=UPI001F5D3F7C|nr:F-box protein SKIP19-like [Lolium rigidum]
MAYSDRSSYNCTVATAELAAGEGYRSMDAALPPVLEEEPPARDWSLLPLDVLSSVFVRVGAVDVLMGAGLMCRSWLQAAMVPDVWRVVDIESREHILWSKKFCTVDMMIRAAIDRSDGQLQVFVGRLFGSVELVKYIVERSPSLRKLRLVLCFIDIFIRPRVPVGVRLASVIRESPLRELRCLEFESGDLTAGELTAILENCPVLEVLTVRKSVWMNDEEEHELRARFHGIKTMTIERLDCGGTTYSENDYGYSDYIDY